MRLRSSYTGTGGRRSIPLQGRRPLTALLAILIASLAVSWLAGTGRRAQHGLIGVTHADDDDDEAGNQVQAPSRLRIVNGRTELVLTRKALENAGIATARPVSATGQASVQAYGEVLDPAALTDLASRYRNARAQVAAASAKAGASRAALMRAQSLYRDRQNISTAQLESARSASQVDEATLDAARSSLTALGATIAQDWGPVLAHAITHRSGLLANLVSRREVLVAVTLPPGEVPDSAPTTASAQLPGGTSIPLTLVSTATTVSPLVQGMRYYYRAAASGGLLSGLNLQVVLRSPTSTRARLIVPESAVVWLQGEPWIYRLASAGHPDRAAVSQVRDGGFSVAGLPPDAAIVVRGAQLLLSEEFRAQVASQGTD